MLYSRKTREETEVYFNAYQIFFCSMTNLIYVLFALKIPTNTINCISILTFQMGGNSFD